jgi:hypothetical protein
MKPGLLAAILCAGLAVAARADDGFTATLSPTDLAAAGLSALTPDQRARLDALVERYRGGAPVAAPAPLAASPEVASPAGEVSPPAKPARPPGLIAQVKQSLKGKPATVLSTLPGKFRGWAPRQVFVLANGQSWQVANNDSYYNPTVENPRVEIRPSAFSGYWLRFPDLDLEVRVMPLDPP